MASEFRSNNPSEKKDAAEYSSAAPVSNASSQASSNAAPTINDDADGLALNQLSLNELSANELAKTERLAAHELTPHDRTGKNPIAGGDPSRSARSNRRPLRHERTDGTTILSLYHFGWSAIYLVGALVMAIPTMITGIVGLADDPGIFWVTGLLGVATFFILGLSLLFFVVGFGLWRLRQWARTAAIAIALVSLPTVLGTIPAALTLWYLFKEEVSSIFR